MKNSLPSLKPKANKLLNFVTNWQLAKPSVNTELCTAIESVIENGTFPGPIRSFFKLPQFKELMGNMKEGKLYKKPDRVDTTTEAVEFHPPEEIQNIQILIEAFHQLVHLDYNRDTIKNPIIQAKVLGENIRNYLSCADLFQSYEGKTVDSILKYLCKSVQDFTSKMASTIKANQDLFTQELIALVDYPIFSLLQTIDRNSYQDYSIEDWYPVLIELNLDSKLEIGVHKMMAIGVANAHKLVNQMQSKLSAKRLFYQRNLPLYRPFDVKKVVLEKLGAMKPTEKIQGQRVNELFYTQFWAEKYGIIDAKQSGTNKKYKSFKEQLWPIKEAIYSLIQQYSVFLPEQFCNYFIDVLHPFNLDAKIFGRPNVHAVQLTIGFYSTQYDYLAELLSEPKELLIPNEAREKIYALFPTFISYLENYYLMRPTPSFVVIRHRLENLFPHDEALADHSVKKAIARVEETFRLLLPCDNHNIELLEAGLHKMTSDLKLIYQSLPPNSVEAILFADRIQCLEIVDIPSLGEGWYALGELFGIFFILLSRVEDLFHDRIKQSEKFLSQYPFFNMLFYHKK